MFSTKNLIIYLQTITKIQYWDRTNQTLHDKMDVECQTNQINERIVRKMNKIYSKLYFKGKAKIKCSTDGI